MVLVLEYILVAVLVGAGLFGLSIFVFGRGEELGPLPRQASPTKLPETGVLGDDVRKLKFQVRLRGYDMREVDWALARLAEELEELRAQSAGHELETADE
ncbi:DivIVA domain-containing protein [Segniliparus rugosus]|uniref:DivIVA domain-containing protein n=1 Tax=Segniliparus rugosus TaxID=286804 RepID=UPI0001F03BBC|nr:DivIVA domain-containing protein [Segniliparus rugosus]